MPRSNYSEDLDELKQLAKRSRLSVTANSRSKRGAAAAVSYAGMDESGPDDDSAPEYKVDSEEEQASDSEDDSDHELGSEEDSDQAESDSEYSEEEALGAGKKAAAAKGSKIDNIAESSKTYTIKPQPEFSDYHSVFNSFAELGLTCFDTEDYFINLSISFEKQKLLKKNMLSQFQKDFPDSGLTAIGESLKDEIVAFKTKKKKNFDKQNGDSAFLRYTVITELGSEPFHHMFAGVKEKIESKISDQEKFLVLKTFLNELDIKDLDAFFASEPREGWRKRDVSGVFDILFDKIKHQYPKVNARQLNKVYLTLRSAVIYVQNKQAKQRSARKSDIQLSQSRKENREAREQAKMPGACAYKGPAKKAYETDHKNWQAFGEVYKLFASYGLDMAQTERLMLKSIEHIREKLAVNMSDFIIKEFDVTENLKAVSALIDNSATAIGELKNKLRTPHKNNATDETRITSETIIKVIAGKGSAELQKIIDDKADKPRQLFDEFASDVGFEKILRADPLAWRESRGNSGLYDAFSKYLQENFEGVSAVQIVQLCHGLGPILVAERVLSQRRTQTNARLERLKAKSVGGAKRKSVEDVEESDQSDEELDSEQADKSKPSAKRSRLTPKSLVSSYKIKSASSLPSYQQNVFDFFAQKCGVSFFDAEDYILKIVEVQRDDFERKLNEDFQDAKLELTGSFKKDLKQFQNAIRKRPKGPSKQKDGYDVASLKYRELALAGCQLLEKQIETLKALDDDKKSDQDKIELLDAFLGSLGIEEVDVLYASTPRSWRIRGESGVYDKLLEAIIEKYPKASAAQFNQLYFLTKPTVLHVRNMQAMKVGNKKVEAERKALRGARRKAAGKVSKGTKAKNKVPQAKGQSAIQSFNELKQKYQPLFDQFAKLGLTIFEAENYLIWHSLEYAQTSDARQSLTDKIADDFSSQLQQNPEILGGIENEAENIRTLKVGLCAKHRNGVKQNKITLNYAPQVMEALGDPDLQEYLETLSDPIVVADFNFFLETLKINGDQKNVILMTEPLDWRKTGTSGIFSKLFDQVKQKYPQASAQQLNDIYYRFSPIVLQDQFEAKKKRNLAAYRERVKDFKAQSEAAVGSAAPGGLFYHSSLSDDSSDLESEMNGENTHGHPSTI